MRAGDVARIFGVDRKTVTRWTKVGLLTFIRTPGGHRRYRAADVAALKSQPYKPRPSGLPALANRQPAPSAQPPAPSAAGSAHDEYAWMFAAAAQGARPEAIAETAGLPVAAVRRILRGNHTRTPIVER